MKIVIRSLFLRIALPVLIVVLILGFLLHFLVLQSISEFAQAEIQRDLQALTHRLYNICSNNYDEILQNGLADDEATRIISQALTLGRFEDFFRQEGLKGIVWTGQGQEVLLKFGLPVPSGIFLKQHPQNGFLQQLSGNASAFYAYHFDFSPWDWHITILKSKEEYANLIHKVREVHLYTFALLLVVSLLLILAVHNAVKRPINAIVQPLQNNLRPDYTGVTAFEFLSKTITRIMESLQKSEEKYRSLVETTTDFVWEMDPDFIYTYASPTIRTILGYDPVEVIGRTIFHFMPPDIAQKAKSRARHILAERLLFKQMENKLSHKDGSIVTLESNGMPVLDPDGRLIGYRGIDRDITEWIENKEQQKKIERKLQQLERLESIGTLAGGLAHDYNNLLSAIMGNISLALEDVPPQGETHEILMEAENATMRAVDLTGQLLTFSRGGAPYKVPGNIQEDINEVLQSIQIPQGISIHLDSAEQLWPLEYDRGQIQNVSRHLILNAIESIADGQKGTIAVSIRNVPVDPEDHNREADLLLSSDKYVGIDISDPGMGIPEQNIPYIFDPYFSTKKMGSRKGMGLGLSIVHSILSRHDGYITVDSTVGKGTVCSIYLPAAFRQSDKDVAVEPMEPERTYRQIQRILLMDDETLIRNLGKRQLKRLGYEVTVVPNGNQAVRLYREAESTNKPFEIVILDLTVKEGYGGEKAVKKILAINPEANVIVSSGYANDPIMVNYRQYGFSAALPKPYSINELYTILKQFIASKTQ